MNTRPLTEIKRAPLAVVLGQILSDNPNESKDSGLKLISDAKKFGVSIRDYLTLSVDVAASESDTKRFRSQDGLMSGYEATLAEMNLPFKNAFRQGITLQAAADTFAMRPGSRALFPEVIDDMMQWNTRQDMFETTQGLVSQTRTVTGNEVITQAIFDDQGQLNTAPIAELANVPIQTIKSSDRAIKFFKHGSAIRTSYEFDRRASLDALTPYANRVNRNLEISKVGSLTSLLVSGDGVHVAATAYAGSTFKNWDVAGTKSLKDNYVALADFLMQRARQGTPIDMILCSYEMWLELFLMFMPVTGNKSVAEHLQDRGAPNMGLALDFIQGVSVRIASSAPAGKLICYSVADTAEELIESGSLLNESETAIKNQSITYVKTMNMGYRLVYGDTRHIFDTTS